MLGVGGTLNGVALESIDSNVVNLKINPLPIISINKQPTDKTVISWTPNLPTFSVAVNNIKDAQLNYQWFWEPLIQKTLSIKLREQLVHHTQLILLTF